MIWFVLLCLGICVYYWQKPKIKIEYRDRVFSDNTVLMEVGKLREQVKLLEKAKDVWEQNAFKAQEMYNQEKQRNDIILSQKKSSETRLGAIAENLVPMLELPYDGKNMHHLGQPIDFIYFDYEEPSITFIEVKTGNAQESKRQKLIKNIIKQGLVYYDLLQITDKKISIKRKL